MYSMMLHMTRFDLRQIARDRMFVAILIAMPLLSLVVVRVMLPVLEQQYTWLAGFEKIAVTFLVLQAGILSGFIVAFMVLEEKDAKTLRALFVSGLSRHYYFIYRALLVVALSMILSICILLLCGVSMGAWKIITLALMSGLQALILATVIVLLANNKVEGLTWFKGFNFVLFVPVIPVSLDLSWSKAMSFIPSWWLFVIGDSTGFDVSQASLGIAYILLLIGLLTGRTVRMLK